MTMPLPPTDPLKGGRGYRRLWRIVDAAVRSALDAHPEYLTEAGRQAVVMSITKRVVGSVIGHMRQKQLPAPSSLTLEQLVTDYLAPAEEA